MHHEIENVENEILRGTLDGLKKLLPPASNEIRIFLSSTFDGKINSFYTFNFNNNINNCIIFGMPRGHSHCCHFERSK